MMDEETIDEILEGGLKICQSKRGYRFNLDSLILAHFVCLKHNTRNLDLGCGNGIILLMLARVFPKTHWMGLEIQEPLARLAVKNVQINNLIGRITIVTGDARKMKNNFPAHSFDNVIFNPPYRKLNSGRINPLPEKAIARHEVSGSLQNFLQASKHVLKPAGKVFTIYPAKRLVELIALFRQHDIEPKRMKLVFSDRSSDAEFALVEGRSNSREELKIEPPLFIYDQPKKYTEEMKRIFTDLARLPSVCDG
jgi:tRNA1Val (adenine37-N6)-methyltransferase